jgi:hypothetical protein
LGGPNGPNCLFLYTSKGQKLKKTRFWAAQSEKSSRKPENVRAKWILPAQTENWSAQNGSWPAQTGFSSRKVKIGRANRFLPARNRPHPRAR